MTNNKTNGVYANFETGEKVEGLLLQNPENYIIISKESEAKRKAYLQGKQHKGIFDEIAGRFTFSLSSTIKELNQDKRFTQTEKTRIIFLGTFVSYQEKGSYLMHDNGNLIYKNKLQSLLEMSNKNEFYKFYNNMLDAGILQEEHINKTTIKLIWSSSYNFRGTAPASALKEKNLIKTFDKQVRELYQEKDAKGKKVHTPNNLYTLFMLLPYVQPESNIICLNPEDVSNPKPLTIQELADLFGYNRSNDLKRKLFKVKLKGLPVFSTISNTNYTHILVNPFIVYRSNKAPNDALLNHFKDTANRLQK